MNLHSRTWLAAAAGVAVVVAVIVLIFGYSSPPQFPSLYEAGAPALEGAVAHQEFGPEDCVWVLDVATGDSQEVFCDSWAWAESWDENGNLRIHAGNGHEQVWVVDPDTGTVLGAEAVEDGPPPEDEGGPPPEEELPLRSRSAEGRVTLTYGAGTDAVTLIDIDAPRNYRFHMYGLTGEGDYAWVCDSEDRLLVVSMDGSSGPWLVAEDISDPIWK
jgi:hypothetical protein